MTAEFFEIGLAAVWRDASGGREVLIARRPEDTHLAGYWELPGGKIEQGESPETTARRELREETGMDLPPHRAQAERLLVVEHAYPDRIVRLHVFLIDGGLADPSELSVEVETRWVPAAELSTYRFPPANDSIIRAIIDRLTPGERPS